MATSFQQPEDSGDKRQSIPKILLVCLVVGLLIIIAAVGSTLKHNHTGPGGPAAGMAGQPADRATGPHLGAEGNANGTTVAPDVSVQPSGAGQGGGPGAMGSGPSSSGPGSSGTGSTPGGGGRGGG